MNAFRQQRVSHSRISEPMVFGDRTIRTVARVRGWRAHGSREPVAVGRVAADRGGRQTALDLAGNQAGAGMWLRVSPAEVIVREASGDGYVVPIDDPEGEALRGMARLAAAVAVASVALGWLVRRWR